MKCAIRTDLWRLVENSRLYDILADPGQVTDVAAEHPDMVKKLSKAYDKWWESTEPFLINEGLTGIARGEHYLQRLSREQSKKTGFSILEPVEFDDSSQASSGQNVETPADD